MAIINNNVGNVKFLRNGNLFATHDGALTGIQNEFSSGITSVNADGTAILARYGSGANVKTLVGWVYFADTTNKSLTIFDIEGASGDVEALRQEINAKLGEGITSANTATAQLEALSGTNADTSATTSVAGAKAYAKDYTDEQIGNLEYTGVTTGNAVVVTNVTESDGIVSATTANVGGLKLTDYSKGSDSGAVVSTDSINEGFSKLENQIDAVNDAISGLDYSDTAVTKQFVAAVDETNGVISVTRGELQSSGKTIVITADGNNVNFEANVDGTTIIVDENTGTMSVASSALVQYEGDGDTIQIGAVSEGVRTVSSPLTISATTPSEANVKEQYNLVGASGNTIGATIKIYKDSALLSVALLHAITTENPQVLPTYDKATDTWTDIDATAQTQANQALCYAYEDVSGNTVIAAVPVGSFINEQEFASGITWDSTANKVRGVVDPTSEKDSQDTPVDFLTVGANGFKISGIKDEIDRQLDAVVEDLDATVTGATSGSHVTISIEELDGKLVQSGLTIEENDIASESDLAELSGKTVTAITSTNGSITASIDDAVGCKTYDIETDASKIKMSGFTADASGFTAITEASTVTEAVKAIETEILANEETVAQALNDLNTRVDTVSGDVETISGKVDTIETNYVSGVSVNGNAVTVANHVAPISVSGSTSAMTATGNEAIVVDTDANGNITLGLAIIDCGTYD